MTQSNQAKPEKEILIDRKEHQSLQEFANMLETIARKLKEQGTFTLVEGEKEVVVTPSQQLKVEYSYEKRGDKHSFEIEFDWKTGDHASSSFKIQ